MVFSIDREFIKSKAGHGLGDGRLFWKRVLIALKKTEVQDAKVTSFLERDHILPKNSKMAWK